MPWTSKIILELKNNKNNTKIKSVNFKVYKQQRWRCWKLYCWSLSSFMLYKVRYSACVDFSWIVWSLLNRSLETRERNRLSFKISNGSQCSEMNWQRSNWYESFLLARSTANEREIELEDYIEQNADLIEKEFDEIEQEMDEELKSKILKQYMKLCGLFGSNFLCIKNSSSIEYTSSACTNSWTFFKIKYILHQTLNWLLNLMCDAQRFHF